MGALLGLLIAAAAMLFVTLPLFTQGGSRARAGVRNVDRQGRLRSRMESDLAQLRQAEQDLKSGTINEEDYHDMEARYRARIEAAQKALGTGARPQKRPAPTNVDREIEKEVEKLRRQRKRR